MANRRDQEERLVHAAGVALEGEVVIAAGIFGWQDLLKAQAAGGTRAGATARGMTAQLLVAVTALAISMFNWDGRAAGRPVIAFDRATTDVRVSRMGLSRIVKLRDRAGGVEISLQATVAPYLAQSKPDKHVLQALAAAG
jgi:hypothetical protein